MNRRVFFKSLSWIIMAPVFVLSYFSIRKDRKTKKTLEVFIPKEAVNQQAIFENVIISNNKGQLSFYSNKCTHLGCSIRHFADGKYSCSCHGSQFDINGKPINGPASKPLTELSYRFIPEKNGYLVFETA